MEEFPKVEKKFGLERWTVREYKVHLVRPLPLRLKASLIVKQ